MARPTVRDCSPRSASALADVPPDRVAGVIMITDGRVHDVPADASALGFAAPVHALITGHKDERDRRVALIAAPRFGIVGQSQTITYRVEDHGAGETSAEVTVRRDGDVLETARVPVGAPQQRRNSDPARRPEHRRDRSLAARRRAHDSEQPRRGRRSTACATSCACCWSPASRMPASAPGATCSSPTPSVDLVHFTILRPPEKQDGTPINELSLIAFPTRELFQQKINEFQLIIFDRYARQGVLPMIYFDNITRYVRDGGAVLVAAGPDYASQTSIWRTPLDSILPAEPSGNVTEPGLSCRG